MGGGRVRDARPRDRAVDRAGDDGRHRPARLGRRRRADVVRPGPDRPGRRPARAPDRGGGAGQPRALRPRGPPHGRAGRVRLPGATRRTPASSCPVGWSRRSCAAPPPCSTGSWHDAPGTTPLLVLEDGRTFRGRAYGAEGETFGEAVFNTGMTGYQETLTDPSYHRQVVVMTAPHIGNTGVNDEDAESDADLGRGLRRARPRARAVELALAAQPRRRAARAGRRRHLRRRHPRADPPPARARRDAGRHLHRPRPTRRRCWSGCATSARDGRRRAGRRGLHDRGVRRARAIGARSRSPSPRWTSASRR